MKIIPFKISARTARLIGKQNFSNVEGAVNELVKNTYDADASNCVIIIDNKFVEIPKVLSLEEYERFNMETELLKHFYILDLKKNRYCFNEEVNSFIDIEKKEILEIFFQSKCAIYIIDNGEGMTDDVIINQWMVIGTDVKEHDIITDSGRIKTGAKGIGRFALDRLGDQAEVRTFPSINKYHKSSNKSYLWSINWNEFDGTSKILNEINANLFERDNRNYKDELDDLSLSKKIKLYDIINKPHGTIIKITALRDKWDNTLISRVYNSLEVLIPPAELRNFSIYLFATENRGEYGKLKTNVCEDFDYKVRALSDGETDIKISITRNEYDVNIIPDDFFRRKKIVDKNITQSNLIKTKNFKKTILELLPGLSNTDAIKNLNDIGNFDFTLYFLKLSQTSDDKKKFFYKDVKSNRKQWMNRFSGIKIYRDNFIVRPYGEIDKSSFDWLDLGARAAQSPAGIGKKGGGWKVRPNQVVGIINISRMSNLKFEDKSNREGLQENLTFRLFKELLKSIINEFEKDRELLSRELKEFFEETNKNLSDDDIDDIERFFKKKSENSTDEDIKEKAKIVVEYIQQQKETIEELKDEQKKLWSLATNSIVTSTLTHELRNIKDNLVIRIDDLKKYIKKIAPTTVLQSLEDFENPLVMVDEMKNDDKKLKEWLGFSLDGLRKDKRRQKEILLNIYFKNLRKLWSKILITRGIDFHIEGDDFIIKIYEIDLDCIFNNLIANSIDAFISKDNISQRKISISCTSENRDMIIYYKDNGPGLLPDIKNHNDIFDHNFTTKRDRKTGEIIGTGLGLWILKSVVDDNNGEIELIKHSGFSIMIKLKNKVLG